MTELADIALERPAPADPFAVPAVALSRLLPFSPDGPVRHRRRIVGTVSLSQPGEFFYLQEGVRGVRVSTRQSEPPLRLGNRVEVAGFPGRSQHFAEIARAHPAGGGGVPQARSPLVPQAGCLCPAGLPALRFWVPRFSPRRASRRRATSISPGRATPRRR